MWGTDTGANRCCGKAIHNARHGRAKAEPHADAHGWNAADGAYYSEAEPVYDSVISADVLDFDGANYLKAPEKRLYYLADLQGLAVRDGGTALFYPVVEFTPAETAVPDHPIKVYVQRFLYPEAENQNNEYEIYVLIN